MIDFIVNKISIKKMQLLFIFVAIFFSLFLITSPSHAITITGSDTITKNSSSQYSVSGCNGTVTWGVTNPGASIQSGVLTTSGACGTVLVAARCSADGSIATQDVRVTNSGQWVFVEAEQLCSGCSMYNGSATIPPYKDCNVGRHRYFASGTCFSNDEGSKTCSPPCGDQPSLGDIPCGERFTCPPPPAAVTRLRVSTRGVWEWRCWSSSTCAYNITPQAEICGDLKDNNCNGQVDEGCGVCTNGQTKTCPYTGTSGTENVGICKAGTQTCSNGQWGTCQGEVLPSAEICDGIDNNCNGQIDEGFDVGAACSVGVGACKRDGVKVCSANGTGTVCSATPGTPSPEICGDGLDNNCDGQVDEGCVVCTDMDGDGYNAISPTCPQGDDSDDNDADIYPGAPEKPDNKDNDNDGQTDENFGQCPNSTPTSSSTSLSTGNYQHTQDVFGITLIYDSRRTSEGAFGKGWTHSYDTKIKTDPDDSLELTEDGVATNFRLSGNIYKAEPRSGIQAEIIKNADNTYTLTRKGGMVYQFDTQGRLLSSTDRNGNSTTLAYTNNPESSSGQALTAISDPVGRITSFTYNASNKISQITDPAGRSTNLSYNTAGLLSSVTNPDAGTWTYAYDSNNRMTSKTDPLGSTTSNTYDANGRMIRATNPEGKTKAIAYDQTNQTSTVTEWNSGIWQYKYDDLLNVQTEIKDPDGNIRTKTYDANKNLVSETDPQGNTSTYTYDSEGNMTSVKDAAGNITSYTYNTFGQATSVTTPDNKTTLYAYDAKGNLTSTTDSSGAVTQYQYDTKGNVIKAISPQLSAISYTYNQYNNPVSITDSTGATTTFTYDISGNTTSVTDSQGNTTRFEYNSQNQIIKVIDSSGNETSSAYDAMGNRTSQTDANGNITRYEYNYKGQVTKVIDSLGGITTYEYGGTGCSSCSGGTDKLTALIDAVGNRTTYEYDLLGRLIKETDSEGKIIVYSYDATGNLISKTDATGITITYAYDTLNRLTSINFPDSTQNISYTYDSTGKVLTMSDPSGTTAYTYDNSNRLIAEIKTIEGKTFNTSYAYTLSGALTSITYPSGRIVSYEYDPIGRIVRVMEEKDGKRSEIIKDITYLSSGAISSITQGNNLVTTKTYDNRNQLSSLSIGNLKQLSYVRDNIGNITAITDLLDATKNKTYQYDALYRLTNAVGPWGAIQYNYDPVGNRLTETSSSGNTTYSYSANKLTSSTGAKAFTFSYDNNGNTVTENQKTFIYNQNQRLIKAVENGQTLGEYTYNANGQRVKKTANGRTTCFIYDQSGNLIEEADENGQINADYIYLGSTAIARVDEWWENMSMPQAPSTVTTTPGDKEITVSWSSSHEPIDGYKIYWGVESGKYTNTADVGKTTTHTITGLTNGATYYIAVKSYADISRTLFYHTDHLGTPVLMTDKQGNKVWEGELLPFGEEYSITGSVINNKRFPGQYYDEETGLHYNGRRTYNPNGGRYLERDPIGLKGGINQWVYARGNPVNYIDWNGLEVSVVITRNTTTSKSISGTINVSSDIVSNTFSGYTLEPVREKGPVPTGTYDAFLRKDHSPWRIELKDVPGNENIQIHVGNYPEDSQGCFLVGTSRSKDFVGGSISAMTKILEVIKKDCSEKIKVTVK